MGLALRRTQRRAFRHSWRHDAGRSCRVGSQELRPDRRLVAQGAVAAEQIERPPAYRRSAIGPSIVEKPPAIIDELDPSLRPHVARRFCHTPTGRGWPCPTNAPTASPGACPCRGVGHPRVTPANSVRFTGRRDRAYSQRLRTFVGASSDATCGNIV
jgi:hypothetical protein